MKTNARFLYFLWLTFLSLLIAQNISAQVKVEIKVERGWNLLSVPVKVLESTKSAVFPTAISDAFMYQDGYIHKDTLTNINGYWLKFDSAETIRFYGEPIHRDTFNLVKGWNMIGSITEILHINMIRTEPSNIIISDFFKYLPQSGYEASDTIRPGLGYWVKTNEDGLLILSSGPPCPGIPTVEYDGKTYNTVQIGTQCWLKENLDVGVMIDSLQNPTNNDTIEKYCYRNEINNCNIYGGLYQWNEMMQYTTTPGTKGICPTGWHIPTYAEFQTLTDAVSWDGNALKAIGQGTGSGAGTNTSGFSALLAGYRYVDGHFHDLSSYAVVWSSTEAYSTSACYMSLYYIYNSNTLGNFYKEYGFSVRCIQGEGANTPPILPYNPHPADSSIDTDTITTLSWSCKDPDHDALTYDVFFGSDNPPSTMVASNQADTSLNRNDLLANTTYYWQIVVKDVHGAYRIGPVWRFTTRYNDGGIHCPDLPFVEYEGKICNTVLIGSQCWLRENLNVGLMIDSLQSSTNNGIMEKYCYRNDPTNCDKYGGLYQWNEAMKYTTVEGAKGICPHGWHIPTFSEFQILKTSVGDDGNTLKAIGQGTGDGAGTNTSGFSALLVGLRTIDGIFNYLGEYNYVWSSTEENVPTIAKGMNLLFYTSGINLTGIGDKGNGFNIRCLKD